MKILSIRELAIPEIKVVKFARFYDNRGYFTEVFNKDDIEKVFDQEVLQINESFSKKNVIRGLHAQWNPLMGKFVRTVKGHMVDLVLDIRKDSPTYGKAIAYDMPISLDLSAESEWIWVPPGFAHGNFYKEVTMIQYLCTGKYSPGCEVSISPLSNDIDWSLCDPTLYSEFEKLCNNGAIISNKDKNGLTLTQWNSNTNSKNFVY